jgi:hypothetical protein
MKHRIWTIIACIVPLALAGGVPSALAGEHHKCCKIDVDIDELKADLYPDGDGWLLNVRYEVDVEHACADEQLTLNLQISDDDCRIVDAHGRPLTHTIALDRPTECDDGEQTFEGCAEIRLAGAAIGDPKEVDVHATVTRAGDACTLDKKNSSAKAHLPVVVVECAPRVVEVRRVEPVVELRRTCVRPVVYVRQECRSAVVEVRRPHSVRVGVRW